MVFSEFFLATIEIPIDYVIKSSVKFYAENCIFLVPFQSWANLIFSNTNFASWA